MKPVFRRVVFRGFTLIELAIVLVIVSLMTGFGMKAMQTERGSEQKCYEETRAQLRVISGAIDAFVRREGFYPRPAPMGYGVDDVGFGTLTADTGTNVGGTSVSTPAWIGALPFSTLGLPASYAADCWGNKFTFMVSKGLGVSSSFSGSSGQITVKSSATANITTTAAYAVISRGENALVPCQRNFKGAHTACFCDTQKNDANTYRLDKHNCDQTDATIYVTAFNNGVNSPTYFDDIVIYKEKVATTVANCVPQDISWNTNCSAPVGQLASGQSTSVSNSASGYTGSATVTCTAGILATSGTSCAAVAANPCNLPWGGTTASGTSVTAYLSATPSGACTSETRTCTDGTLSGSYTAQTCAAGCATAAQTWLTNCTASATATTAGATRALTNTAANYSGSATATCDAGGAGTWALSGTSCSTTSCTLPWGGTTATGTSVTAYLAATPSGPCTSQSRTCTNGTLSGTYTNQTCTAGCAASTQTWLTNCSANATAAVAGAAQSLTNTAANYGGAATATCNAGGSGAFALSATSCTETCALPWGGTINSGQSVTAYSSTAPVGTCTSETRSCTAAASCAAATVSWTDELNCSKVTSGTLAHNATEALVVSTTLKDGYCVARCNNGTLSCDAGYYCVSSSGSSCSTC